MSNILATYIVLYNSCIVNDKETKGKWIVKTKKTNLKS